MNALVLANRLRPLLLLVCLLATPLTAEAFELRDGDRVVFLGDGLIEQAQYFGWVETMMTTHFPQRDVHFRNLGWNADTPAGDSRYGLSLVQAGRAPAGEGWRQLQNQLELTRPSVLVVGYGMASALEGGAAGLDAFLADYRRLLRRTQEISPDVRFVLLSPLQRLDADHPQTAVLKRYSEGIRQLADDFESPYVDLRGLASDAALRKDPIHLNGEGYVALAKAIEAGLHWPAGQWREASQSEALRQVILRKNEWWFHRSRPANMAYVFGFRKHEQGQNAQEIPQFDALIADEEARIARLRSLDAEAVPEAEARVESKFAKFVEQETPEFTLGDELEVTLWAENPQLNKPIQINFDPQGRLWVASSEAYPMIEVGQAAPDKIVVLEDTDEDGRADESTVFAEGLLIPTGVVPGDGGAYVAQSTDLLFLKDTDGDGKADQKRRVLSGFGTEDTHHNLHTLTWGPDGRLYMNQSVYTRTDTETPRGVVRLKAGGGFRYNPDSMRMQVFFRGLWNSWGHQFNDYGQSFLTDGAGFAGIAYAFPGAQFNPTPGARRQLDLISPGSYPKFASLEIISGEAFPPAWQGSIVTCDFRANRVTRFSLQPQDAGYVTRQEADLMRTSASTFRPIDVKQGPDGALYIADWSNPIINHGEVDFRDERRDRWHGRIWRLAWKGATPQAKVDLRALETPDLLDNLLSEDRFRREQSRRVLLERAGIAAAVDTWMAQQDAPSARLQGMWLYQAAGALDKLPLDLLECEVGPIRAAAVRVLADFADPQTDHPQRLDWAAAAEWLAPRVRDPHPQVRLEAVRALGKFASAEAAALALEVLDQPLDRFLEFALGLTIDEASQPLMEAIEEGRWVADSPAKTKQLAFVLTAIEPSRASRFLAERMEREPLPKDGSGPWIELIGSAGGAAELGELYQQTRAGRFEPAATVRALQTLDRAARLRKLRPAGSLEGLGQLLEAETEAVRQAAVKLAGTWQLAGQRGRLATIAAAAEQPGRLRLMAVDALREVGSAEAAQALVALASEQVDRPVRERAIVALAGLRPDQGSDLFYQSLQRVENETEALEFWRAMLRAQGIGEHLTARLAQAELSEMQARAGVRACRDGGRDEPALLAALRPLAGMTMTAEALTPQRVEELVARVGAAGDPRRGEAIYMRSELGCVNCHAIGGVGGKVGPDMTSLGASAPLDYLIESLFDPNAKIKEGYHAVTVLTEDGMIVNGVEGESTENELVLRNAEDKLVRIPAADVVLKKAGKSLMPTGVIDRLPLEEQVDLISFLSRLGKPGAFDASRGGVARVYEILAGTHRREQQGAEQIIEGTREEGWKPLQARVNGEIGRATMQAMTKPPRNISLVNVYLRTRINVPQTGPVELRLQGPEQAALWVDGKAWEGEADFHGKLAAGEHTVLVRLDARALPETVRLASADVTFATEQ